MKAQKKITIFVILFHLFLLGLFSFRTSTAKKKPNKIAVKTIHLTPLKSTPIKRVSSKAPTKQKKIRKKGKTTSPKPKTNTRTKESIPTSLINKLEESIAKMDSGEIISSENSLKAPKPIIDLFIDSENQNSATAVNDVENRIKYLLMDYLKKNLQLPEYGEVTIRLTLKNQQVENCEIVCAKNSKNAEYLKNRLPQLALPCLNSLVEEQTFLITFRNEV